MLMMLMLQPHTTHQTYIAIDTYKKWPSSMILPALSLQLWDFPATFLMIFCSNGSWILPWSKSDLAQSKAAFKSDKHSMYPLVNVYKKLWKDPSCFMGKSTISMAIFNSFTWNPQHPCFFFGRKFWLRAVVLKKKTEKMRFCKNQTGWNNSCN